MAPSTPRSLPSIPVPADDQGPARRHWSALTITVAWELARAATRVRPPLLHAAREHVAWRLAANASLAETEAVAAVATREFLARRKGNYARWTPDPDVDILPDPRWREAVIATSTPLHEAVFRLHFGDGVPLEELAPRLKVDVSWLRPAREAVRELVRVIVAEDGVPTEGWEPARVDRLVSRVALAAGDRCPGPGGLGTDIGRAHGESCPRCGRALRLIREGVLATGDLFAPDASMPPANTTLTLLQVHAEARKHLAELVRVLPGAVRVADDQLMYAGDEALDVALRDLAEAATPARTQLRLVRASVPGRIVDGVVIGRAYDSLQEAVQLLPWGEARGVAALPEPLPPPPSAARWWATAALLASLAMVAAVAAMQAREPGPLFVVRASRDATGVTFDTDDSAFVDVLAIAPDRAEVVFHSATPADKASLVTGDGRYHAEVDARPLLVVASPTRIEDAAIVVAAARDVDDARVRLHSRYPEAAIVVIR